MTATKYAYRLGHQAEVSQIEFDFNSSQDYQLKGSWIFSEEYLDITRFGGLVFSGKILSSFTVKEKISAKDYRILLKKELAALKTYYSFPKKLGVSYSREFESLEINDFKQLGVKKVNLLKPSQIPSFGNFKNTKNWIIIEKIQTEVYIIEVNQVFNQELFSKLDLELPASEMKRGMINLKLARSLNNLSKNPKIWDPFCGLGRNAVASFDLKKEFFLSDIDSTINQAVKSNLKKAAEIYGLKSEPVYKILSGGQDITKFNPDLLTEVAGFSVVTEGYLGKNFKTRPNPKALRKEIEIVEKIWFKALKNFEKYKIQEVIFCLPCYDFKNLQLMPELNKIVSGSRYKFSQLLPGRSSFKYSRYDSLTVHLIVKAQIF